MGCKSAKISDFNRQVDLAIKKSIAESPFESAKTMNSELKNQLKIREKYLSIIDEVRLDYPKQDIILIERYSYICLGCVADYVTIFTNGLLINLTFDMNKREYLEQSRQVQTKDLLFQNGFYEDIMEIFEQLGSEKKWNSEPDLHGNEDCFDGDQSFYTVFYPSGELESMYMRCWLPKNIIDNN